MWAVCHLCGSNLPFYCTVTRQVPISKTKHFRCYLYASLCIYSHHVTLLRGLNPTRIIKTQQHTYYAKHSKLCKNRLSFSSAFFCRPHFMAITQLPLLHMRCGIGLNIREEECHSCSRSHSTDKVYLYLIFAVASECRVVDKNGRYWGKVWKKRGWCGGPEEF